MQTDVAQTENQKGDHRFRPKALTLIAAVHLNSKISLPSIVIAVSKSQNTDELATVLLRDAERQLALAIRQLLLNSSVQPFFSFCLIQWAAFLVSIHFRIG